jgi:hypothetical protein
MERMKTCLTLACVLIAIAAGGLAWRQSVLARRAEMALADAETRIEALEKKLQTAKAAGERETLGAEGSSRGRAAPEREQSGRLGRRGEPPDFSNDPEIAPLMLKQRQRQIASRYAALFARLGLSPEMREKLQALLADKQISHFDAMGLARRQGLGREEAMELALQADAESDSAIRSLIGDAAYAQLEYYDRTYAQRSSVNRVGHAAQLCWHSAFDRAAGTADLGVGRSLGGRRARGRHGPRFRAAGGAGGPAMRGLFGRDVTQTDIDAFFAKKAESDADALTAVTSFLTQPQVEAVRQLQQEENDRLRLAALRFDRFRRARGDNGG